MVSFASQLALALTQGRCQARGLWGGKGELVVKMDVAKGLLMSCKICLDTRVNMDEKLNQFQMVLKLFGRQLFEANEIGAKNKVQIKGKMEEKEKEKEGKIETLETVKIFMKPQQKTVPEKYRDLINPMRKRRNREGVKIGGDRRDSSEDMS